MFYGWASFSCILFQTIMEITPRLPLILITAFLDILGMSLLIPSFPSITQHFGQAQSWSMWVQAISSLGMFFAGSIIGSFSDTYGRKRMLLVTSMINILWYIGTYSAIKYGSTVGIVWFVWYLVARFIAGIGWAGFWVIQAYIADISNPSERTKNMGMMGATFGMAFLIGPAIGGILSKVIGIENLLIFSIAIVMINFFWITFWLSEPHRHRHGSDNEDTAKWTVTAGIYFFLFLSLMTSIGFSAIQGGSSQYTAEKFHFDPSMIGFSMAVVGMTSVLYQWFLVKYVRKYLDEVRMMQFGLGLIAVGMILYAMNNVGWAVFFITILFPLGMGSFNPSLATLLSKDAGSHVGRVMGMNTSTVGIGGIIWPILMWWLYAIHIELPFWGSAAIFSALFIIVMVYFPFFRPYRK